MQTSGTVRKRQVFHETSGRMIGAYGLITMDTDVYTNLSLSKTAWPTGYRVRKD